jgi:histone demethylase JARID1
MSSLSTSLKNSYQKWLQPYEDWLRYNKPNVLQQQEFENGGPYTPSPAPTPIKSQQHTPSIGASSPAVRASSALNAALLNESNTALPSVEAPAPAPAPAPPPPVRYPMPSGFTAVNSGGFTAVNAPSHTPVLPPQAQSQTPVPSSFSAINAQNGIYHSDTGRSTPQRSEASPMSSANTPDMRPFAPSGLAVPPPLNGQGLVPLKRGLSSDDPDSVASGDGDAAGRKSKRRKQGEFLFASCMQPFSNGEIACARISRHTSRLISHVSERLI